VRALILGARAPVALDHARRFAAQGWNVSVADSVSCRVSGWSRSVQSTFALPQPRVALSAFARELSSLVSRERIDVVLPTCEEVFFVSRIRESLPAQCNVFVAPFELLARLHSKWTFLEEARLAGIPVPESGRVSDLNQARDWACGRPVVLKPEFSRFGTHTRTFRAGIGAGTLPALPKLGTWIVQDFVPGREVCSYSIAVAGQLLAHVVYLPKYRLQASSSYYFEPLLIPSIDSHVESLVGRLGFTGQISFDWIERSQGEFVALECNPRAISGLHLFNCLQPLPAVIAGQLTTRVGVESRVPRMLAVVMLAAGLPAAMRSGTFATWHRDWMRATDVLTVPGDHRPILGAVRDLMSFAHLALRQRCSLREATTHDIEWDGQPLCER